MSDQRMIGHQQDGTFQCTEVHHCPFVKEFKEERDIYKEMHKDTFSKFDSMVQTEVELRGEIEELKEELNARKGGEV